MEKIFLIFLLLLLLLNKEKFLFLICLEKELSNSLGNNFIFVN